MPDRSTATASHINAYRRHADGRTASTWYYAREGNWLYEFEDSSGRTGFFESAKEFREFLRWEEWQPVGSPTPDTTT